MARVKIDRDVEVLVASNMTAYYNYNNGRDIAFELDGFETEEYLTFGDLKTISTGRGKSILNNMHILILDVLDNDITKDMVLEQLRLKGNYDKTRELFDLDDDVELEPLEFITFIESSTPDQINKALKEYDFLQSTIEDISVELYKEGKIENDKMAVILEHRGVSEDGRYQFLEDIKTSLK